MNIVVLVLDSISKGQFSRKMKQTEKVLELVNYGFDSNHKSFTFSGHSILGDNTVPNMIPFITGKSVEEFTKIPGVSFVNKMLSVSSWNVTKFVSSF
jgi:hypothetical protein